jgi:hypothetical protein
MLNAQKVNARAANRRRGAGSGLLARRRRRDNRRMQKRALLALLVALVVLGSAGARPAATDDSGPRYTRDGQLLPPRDYRGWIYLTSGLDMSYNAAMQMGNAHMFDNVFVDPRAYAAFRATGTWPDKTQLVKETRAARTRGSINVHGQFQSDILGIEVHVRDTARFGGKWAFFAFDTGTPSAAMIPRSAACYACHSAHGAVDTTFVQFYPTLLPIARRAGTLTRAYAAEGSPSPH